MRAAALLLALAACGCAEAEARGRSGGRRAQVAAAPLPEYGISATETRTLAFVFWGQSLCNGGQGTAAINTVQLYSHLRQVGGARVALASDRDGEGGTGVPKVEAPTVETLAQITALGGPDDMVAIVSCTSNAPWSQIRKGGSGSEWSTITTQLADLVADVGDIRVAAVVLDHGEADTNTNSEFGYVSAMATAWADIQADLASATGQTEPIPLVMRQTNSASAYNKEHSLMAQQQLDAEVADRIWVAQAKSYFLAAPDDKHLTDASYQTNGEIMGHFLYELLWRGTRTPLVLRPSSAVITDDDLVLTYSGCTSPLVLDTTAITQTGLDSHGFRVYESGGITISSVAVSGCTVTLAGSGSWYSGTRVAYAYGCPGSASCVGTAHGKVTGMRGSLRDSAARASRHGGAALPNWAAAFGPSEIVPTGGAASPPLTNSQSIDLDGTGDYVTHADAAYLDPTTKVTICADMYADSTATQGGIYSKSTQNDCSFGFYLGSASTGRLFFTQCVLGTADRGTTYDAAPLATVPDATWVRACVAYDGTQATEGDRVRFSAAGVTVTPNASAGTSPTSLRNSAASAAIGTLRDGNDASHTSFNGKLKNVVVWNDAVAQATLDTYTSGWGSPVGIGSGAYDATLVVFARLGDGYVEQSTGTWTGTPEGISGSVIWSTNVYNSASGYENDYWTLNGNPTRSTAHP